MDNRQHSGSTIARPHRSLDRIFNKEPRESFKTRGQKKRSSIDRPLVSRAAVSKAAKIWKKAMLLRGRGKRGKKVGVYVSWKEARAKSYEWYGNIAGAGGL